MVDFNELCSGLDLMCDAYGEVGPIFRGLRTLAALDPNPARGARVLDLVASAAAGLRQFRDSITAIRDELAKGGVAKEKTGAH